jgi:hypothetical protein
MAIAVALAAPADGARPVGKVRSIAPERSYEPVIAHRARRDEYLVVYARSDPDAAEGVTLNSQRVSRSGGAVGRPVQVALLSPQAPPQGQALVYNPRRDEFLLVWRAATGPPNAPHEVYGQRLDAAGKPIGGRATLVRAAEPGLRPVTQCCMPPALAYDGRGGYFVAWGTAAGFTDHAVAGRPLNGALKRGTARKLTTRKGSITGYSIAADPSGYLLASWIGGPESAQGVYTDLVTRAGVRRRSTYRVHSPGGDVALARNSRTGRFALAWQEDRSIMDSEEPLRVQQLDASGRSLGPRSVVPPYKNYRRTTLEGLAYNHAANEYVLGWIGIDQRDPTRIDARSSLRSLAGGSAKPFGPVSLPAGLFGPFAGASTRAARWLVMSSSQTGLVGQIYAPNRR